MHYLKFIFQHPTEKVETQITAPKVETPSVTEQSVNTNGVINGASEGVRAGVRQEAGDAITEAGGNTQEAENEVRNSLQNNESKNTSPSVYSPQRLEKAENTLLQTIGQEAFDELSPTEQQEQIQVEATKLIINEFDQYDNNGDIISEDVDELSRESFLDQISQTAESLNISPEELATAVALQVDGVATDLVRKMDGEDINIDSEQLIQSVEELASNLSQIRQNSEYADLSSAQMLALLEQGVNSENVEAIRNRPVPEVAPLNQRVASNPLYQDLTGGSYSPGSSGYQQNMNRYYGNSHLDRQFDSSKEAGNFTFDGVDKNNLISQLESHPEHLATAEELAELVGKEGWDTAIYRHALTKAKQGQEFSTDQPLLLHHFSSETSAVYFPNENFTFHHSTNGITDKMGTRSESNQTPPGSFNIRAMTNGRFRFRLGVEGLESTNANSDERLIRIHNIRSSNTHGCIGLPDDVGIKLQQAAARHGGGGMEIF